MICEICGEDRAVQKCHILSRKLDNALKGYVIDGKPYSEQNTLLLCPNHHWAFDHDLLKKDELSKIDKKIFRMVIGFNKLLNIFISNIDNKDHSEWYKKHSEKAVLYNKTIRSRFWKDYGCRDDINAREAYESYTREQNVEGSQT